MFYSAQWLLFLYLVAIGLSGQLQAQMPAAFPAAQEPADTAEAVIAPPATQAPYTVNPPTSSGSQTVGPSSLVLRVGRFPGSYCWDLDCPSCGFPQFYFRADALILQRDNNSGNQPVVVQNGTGATVLTTHSGDFDFRWGHSYVSGYRPDPYTAWEASYFGVQGWNASAVATGTNLLDLPLPLSAGTFNFTGAEVMGLTYRSQLHNVEANGLWNVNGPLWLLAGFRYLNLNERFNISSTDLTTGTSDYNVHTNNNLIGAQIGSRLQQHWGRFGLALTGKAGLFGNAIHQRQLIGDLNNTVVLRDVRSSKDMLSFVTDLGLVATCQLTKHVAVRGGYNLIFIDQVALAPDQLDFSLDASSGRRLTGNGDVFLHGANIGLDARW